MIARCAGGLIAALCLAVALPACARVVWFAETGSLSRLDVDTGALQTESVREEILGIAPASSDSAWVLTQGALYRIDASFVERARVDVDPLAFDGSTVMAADPVGNGVWIASGRQIAGFDMAGRRTASWTAAEPVRVLVTAGPDAVFVASATTLTRYGSDGAIVARLDLVDLRGSDVRAMHVDTLSGTLWLVRSDALVQVDIFAGLVPRGTHPLQSPEASALDPVSGELTLLSGRTIARYGRNALPLAPDVFASQSLDAPAGADVALRRPLLWIGDRLSLGAIDLVSGVLERVAGTQGIGRFAASPLLLRPAVRMSVATSPGGDELRVQVKYAALCDGSACTVAPTYLRELHLDAQVGTRSVSDLFVRDPSWDGASGRIPDSIWPAGATLQAWVTDPYGNRSEVQTLARRDVAAMVSLEGGALAAGVATVAITAPLPNATYTAPASIAITASATAGTGAAVAKVELFGNGILIGTRTASPFSFTWSGVQVGAYSLTAKVTDNLGGTATSAAVPIVVKAGAMAVPVAAYLLNDAWASPGIVTDAIGVRNGAASGAVSSIASPAALPKPDTCRAASFAGGAIDIASLPVSLAAGAKTTVAFWMYWTGADAVIPLGWVTHDLLLSSGSFGFGTLNSDVYGIASTGLANGWHHVVAEFTNGGVTANKLYIDGISQALTQRIGTPIAANAVVAANLRVGGLVGSATNRFVGNLDEIKVFTRALTPTEVSAEFSAANACGTAPAAALTAPASNATFVAPATIAMTASAAATGTTVAKVEFYNGATLLGTDTTTPYAYTWASVPVGTYALKAKSIDAKGMATVSAIANVQVKANVAPAVSLTSPANNSTFTAPATIGLAATASDSDGTVAKVDFYQGTIKLGTATAAPYAYTWTNVAGGSYALTAKAIDDKGAVTTSTVVNVKVNKVPTVSITAPANNANIVLPATITINASASDADGSVGKVDFYRDGVLLGTDTTSPYSYAWTNATPGTYVLTAKATDNLGAVATSAPVTITAKANQPPTIAITSPAGGAQLLTGILYPVTAAASDPDGTIAQVAFYSRYAQMDVLDGIATAPPYTASKSFGAAGTAVMYAVATDNRGATTTSATVSYTVTQNRPPAVTLTSPANNQVFVSPASPPDITLAATASDPDGNLVAVRFYKQSLGPAGDAEPVLLATLTAPPYQYVWHAVPYTDSTGQGIDSHAIWAEASDSANIASTSDIANVSVLQGTARTIAITAPYSDPTGLRTVDFVAPATIVLTAVSPSVDYDAAAKVDFIADGVVVGTVTAPNGSNGEYVAVWRNVPAGAKSVTARITDVYGATATSSPVLIRVVAPAPPASVVLQTPTTGQVFSPYLSNTDIPMAASVNDPGGAVTQVGFYCDYRQVALTATTPYGGTCPGPPPGVHVVTAQAMDSVGNVYGVSRPAYVDVPYGSRPVVAVMTSPSPTGSYSNGTPITLSVEAYSADHAISQVDFYQGPYLIASVTKPPFAVTGYSSAGLQTYYAVAYIPFGSTVTLPVTINVSGSGGGASVALALPKEGQVFASGASIPLAVNVSDPSHLIKQMSYYVGDQPNATVVATSTQPPYAATWTGAADGIHTLTAVGLYATSGQASSAPVRITVGTSGTPGVTLTAPKAGSTYAPGQTISVTAQAYTGGAPLSRIDFIADGAVIGTMPGTGGFASVSLIFDWAGAGAGPHTLGAKALAVDGTSLTAPSVVVMVSDLAVELVEPFAGQNYLAPGDIRITANPSETGGTIAAVDFYGDGALVGTRTTAPYTFMWTGVATGAHSVAAVVRDASGLARTTPSQGINVLAAPTLQVDAGIDGESVSDDDVSIGGIVAAPPNSAVAVNGHLATLDRSGHFFASGIELKPGSNVVTLVLNTQDAAAVTRTVTVNSSGAAPFKVMLYPQEGLAPLATTLTIVNRGGVAFQRIEVDTDDDGTPEITLTGLTNQRADIALNYPTPGTSTVRVTVFDASNNPIYLTRRKVRAMSPAELGAKIVGVYTGMVDRLFFSDSSGALRHFTGDSQKNYSRVFAALGSSLPSVAAQLGTLIDGVIGEETAELTIARDTGAGTNVFMIYLLRGGDGLWHIESM